MELESAADRLAMIESLGGVACRVRGQAFTAIFENGFAEALGIESTDPSLTMPTSEIARVGIVKDDLIEVTGKEFVVARIEDDGTGMSRVQLAD